MNLLLLAPSEVSVDGRAHLGATDRRTQHVQRVLRASVGQSLRAGALDGALGSAVIERTDRDGVTLTCRFDAESPPARDVLLLAIPRPKVLLRCVESAAALGYGRVLLVRTWRTDKSHVEASALAGDTLRAHAILGLEQAQRTRVPRIEIFPLFKPFVEDHLDARCGDSSRLLADPDAATGIVSLAPLGDAPFALAIGPERGFTPYERDALAARGFVAVSAGPHPLRVETALAFVSGQLTLLRQLRA